jgi:hypothetical protein
MYEDEKEVAMEEMYMTMMCEYIKWFKITFENLMS